MYKDKDPKQWIWWAIPIVVVAGLAVALYYGRHKQPVVAAAVQPAPIAVPAPPPHHPIEPTDANQPLPALADSDPAVQESLAEIFGRSLARLLVPKDIIRHVVVTVDNLPRKKTAVKFWPLKPTGGQFVVSGSDEPVLSPDNAARYAPLIKLVQDTDVGQMAAIYKRFYPLFQQAYVALGYPDGYFNNRLVEVIDHLLQTPPLPDEVQLRQPSVVYEFADPTLEGLSAGQKLLLRMGNDHAAVAKEKLRELRTQIAKS